MEKLVNFFYWFSIIIHFFIAYQNSLPATGIADVEPFYTFRGHKYFIVIYSVSKNI